jgi:FAD:protein FMN transferase
VAAGSSTVSVEALLMGGRVGVHVRHDGAAAARAERDAERTLQRIGRWADRLSRQAVTSELSRLNADDRATVSVGPTLAAVLGIGRGASGWTDGIVDITLHDARLAAESGIGGRRVGAPSSGVDAWRLERGSRGGCVHRRPGVRFDLDGVAKGWIADRAARLLTRYEAIAVDADGDVAVALAPGEAWFVGIADPGDRRRSIGVLELGGLDPGGHTTYGVATSGTTVHRWRHGSETNHHLIDPRTGRSARTDVAQATVLAASAAEAEVAAKTAVIVGSETALSLPDRAGIQALVLVTTDGRALASPSALRWLI